LPSETFSDWSCRRRRSFDDFSDASLIDLETHEAVFTWLLQRLADAGLVKGIEARSSRRVPRLSGTARSGARRERHVKAQQLSVELLGLREVLHANCELVEAPESAAL